MKPSSESTEVSWGMPLAVEASLLDDALARRRLFAELLDLEEAPPRVGRFRIEGRLGSGGMGTVWAAHDEELDRPVALKFLHQRSASDPRQLVHEARSLAKINHPNVVAVYDVGDQDGQVWIAMEQVPGRTLRANGDSDDSPQERLQWWLSAGEGLAAVHAAGLVHRDIKPANVLLGEDGRVRLIDFGLVCAPKESGTREPSDRPTDPASDDSETHLLGFAGTWVYAAPEQRRGGPTIDARTDQYSFCVAVWESLAGTRPQLDVDPASRPRPPGMSHRVHRALARGLATAPDQRYPDMHALLAALAPRRPARWIPAAVVSAGLAGLLGFGLRPAPVVADPCAGVDGAASAIWSPERPAGVDGALPGTAAAPLVPLAINSWVERWSHAARTSCRESLVDHVRSPQVHDRRMACLERRLDGLRAVVTQLGSSEQMSSLGPWLEALRAPEACLESAASEGGPQPPPEAIADELHALRQTLTRAQHGDPQLLSLKERLETAEAVSARSQELQWPQLTGEAARVRAILHRRGGQAEPARLAIGQALDLSRESGDTELEADAWTELVAVARDLDLDLDQAQWALDRRRTMVSALTAAPRQAARLAAQQGLLLGLQGDIDGGQALLLEADAGFAELGALAAWERASALRDFGNLQTQGGDAAGGVEALARARSLELELQAAPAPGSEDPAAPAQTPEGMATFNEGLSHLQAGDFAAAETALERARMRFSQEQGPRGPDVVRTLLGLTALADMRGDLGSARAHTEQARMLAPVAFGPLDRERADVLSAVGTVAYRERRYAAAAEAFDRALRILAHHESTTATDQALAASNLAEALVALGQHRRAQGLLEPALAHLEEALGPDHPDLAYPLKALGAAELGLMNPIGAASTLARALPLFESAEHSPELAETLWLSAQAQWETGAHAPARGLAERAHTYYVDLGAEWSTPARDVEQWLLTHPDDQPRTQGLAMSNHIITVTNAAQDLRADQADITAEFGDAIELVNNSDLAVLVKFCLVDSVDRVIECPSEIGPLAAGQTHTGLVIPNTSDGRFINAIHVVAGDSWPKIIVRPINSTSR